ncbi:MAG: hypothetical protein ITD33_01630 [Nitrosarchaeum sp.]|nr:hypothetical protein [Nitrosarchaeum sp.]MBP0119553.1 hypothetical protein [Nitrosarchaeum sp.]MBP0133565.1 hypothetical protein [Nitrosarchaeum sp.]
MSSDDIEVPKELREFMLKGAEETLLGQSNGAKRQFRYGNLHIREYDNKFLVHTDKIDPRKDPIGHLAYDAPEVMVGLACSILVGSKIMKKFLNDKKLNKSNVTAIIISSIIAGYVGYITSKKIKKYLK